MRAPKVTRATLAVSIVGSVCAGMFALGPFSGAIVNSVIVEVAIAQSAHLPVPVLLPAALDGLGGVALIGLAVLRPDPAFRTWLWALVFAALGASMGANGAHAVFPLDAQGRPELPPYFALGVAFVPPLSAAATAHLLLRIGQRLAGLVAQILASTDAPPRDTPARPSPPPRLALPDARVLELARAGGGYRSVMKATGWTRSKATAALARAHDHLRSAAQAEAVA